VGKFQPSAARPELLTNRGGVCGQSLDKERDQSQQVPAAKDMSVTPPRIPTKDQTRRALTVEKLRLLPPTARHLMLEKRRGRKREH